MSATSSEGAHYRHCSGITADQERTALANIYQYVVQRHQVKQAAGEVGGEDDARKDINDSRT